MADCTAGEASAGDSLPSICRRVDIPRLTALVAIPIAVLLYTHRLADRAFRKICSTHHADQRPGRVHRGFGAEDPLILLITSRCQQTGERSDLRFNLRYGSQDETSGRRGGSVIARLEGAIAKYDEITWRRRLAGCGPDRQRRDGARRAIESGTDEMFEAILLYALDPLQDGSGNAGIGGIGRHHF